MEKKNPPPSPTPQIIKMEAPRRDPFFIVHLTQFNQKCTTHRTGHNNHPTSYVNQNRTNKQENMICFHNGINKEKN